jgi:hypothetical protein
LFLLKWDIYYDSNRAECGVEFEYIGTATMGFWHFLITIMIAIIIAITITIVAVEKEKYVAGIVYSNNEPCELVRLFK